MRRRLFLTTLIATAMLAPMARAGNDDSCDIGVTPAATLLLPYFEVDFHAPANTTLTTLFTVTNTSALPQIAHVTLWTDWTFAALNFNLFLPPYGVQSVNLFDLFTRGALASGVQLNGNPMVDRLQDNPNLTTSPSAADSVTTACSFIPGFLPRPYLDDLRQIFTTGVPGTIIGASCSGRIGGTHADAIGYVTVDVVRTCTADFPGPEYFTSDVLFDNVLIGDYETVNGNPIFGNYAGGNPMVHIRALPEGGPAGSNPGTNLPYTFYDRYTATTPQTLPRSIDRRQPLPSTFAARWVQGGPTAFSTSYQIWREGLTGPSSTSCSVAVNSAIPLSPTDSFVRFDEHENSVGNAPTCCCILCPPLIGPLLPASSSTATSSFQFPPITASGDVGGWMYLNFYPGPVPAYSSSLRTNQNWVTVAMQAEGRYAALFDAAQLGNGCSRPTPPGTTVGPTGGVPVCPAGASGCTPGVPPYTGTNDTASPPL